MSSRAHVSYDDIPVTTPEPATDNWDWLDGPSYNETRAFLVVFVLLSGTLGMLFNLILSRTALL